MLARSQFRTCHSPNQRIQPRDGKEQKGSSEPFLLGINIYMIGQITYSGLFPKKHPSPVGTAQGYNQPKPVAPVVPVTQQPVKS
jgi:hypothetical protein